GYRLDLRSFRRHLRQWDMHPFEPGSRGGAGVVRNAWRRISQGPERLRFRRRTVAPENGSRSEPVGRPQDQWQEQEYEDDRGQETPSRAPARRPLEARRRG